MKLMTLPAPMRRWQVVKSWRTASDLPICNPIQTQHPSDRDMVKLSGTEHRRGMVVVCRPPSRGCRTTFYDDLSATLDDLGDGSDHDRL